MISFCGVSTDALATKWSVENGRPTKAVAKPFYAALERGADPNLGQSSAPDMAQVRRELPEGTVDWRSMLSGYRPGKSQACSNRRAIWSCMEALGWTKIELPHTAAGGGGDTYYFPPGVTQQNGYRCHSTEHKDGQPAPLGKAGRAYYKNMGAVVRHLRKQHGMLLPGGMTSPAPAIVRRQCLRLISADSGLI